MKQSSNSLRAEGQADWSNIRNLLLVRLRSIGDTVLMTPCLTALKQWRRDLRIAVVLEKPSAPLLDDHPDVDELIVIDRSLNQWRDGLERLRLIQRLRKKKDDLAINLHGGTTGTFLTYASGARLRAGYQGYRYSFLLNRRAPAPNEIWGKPEIHSAEQQLGLLKWLGAPIGAPAPTSLIVTEALRNSATRRLARAGLRGAFALIHPAATDENKRWSIPKFARIVRYLSTSFGLPSLIVAGPHEGHILDAIKGFAGSAAYPFRDLPLRELVAISSMARIFIGNDSGPAHIAAAVSCPVVVVFGASNPTVWRPWGKGPSYVVRAETDLSGRRLAPDERIHHATIEGVMRGIDQLLAGSQPENGPPGQHPGASFKRSVP